MTTFTTEVPRDRFGRPMILTPAGKREPYQRVTTFTKTVEDTYNIQKWVQRQTALGLAAREDILRGIAAADPTDKRTINDLCEKAMEASKAGEKAQIGTDLHSYTERVDRGLIAIADIPAHYRKDVEAYVSATRELQNLHIETFRVHDAWKVAGTADRIVKYKGQQYIADIKTGGIEWGSVGIAMQLAMYSRSTPYVDDQRVPDSDPIDYTRGIVIHLPAGTGTCSLQWIDLEKGWRGCQIAHNIREARTWKNKIIWPLEEPANPVVLSSDWAAQTSDRAQHAQTLDELRELWAEVAGSPEGLSDEFRFAAQKRAEQLK